MRLRAAEDVGPYPLQPQTKSPCIIAEMSANHCGDLDLAKKIIAAEKEVGAEFGAYLKRQEAG